MAARKRSRFVEIRDGMTLVRRAVRGEAYAFGRNSMITHRWCRGKTQGQSPGTILMFDQVPLIARQS